MLSLILAVLTAVILIVPSVPIPGTVAQTNDVEPLSGNVIVVLKGDVPAEDFTQSDNAAGIDPDFVYTEVFDGFAAEITPQQAEILAEDPNVVAIYPDTVFRQAEQTLPTGLDRIDADVNPSSDIDQTDDVRIAADVAVLDTGISSTTGDLNLIGGTNCIADGLGFDSDGTGHGTHVAGTIGALDNTIDAVGAAPGVRLWSVRVLNSAGIGSAASIVCGLDWVARRASTIEVVNMSLEGGGVDGECEADPVHLAICALVNDAGVPVVVAAGNGGQDASNTIPATYEQVITVSNVADFDGQPGGLSTANSCSPANTDDTLASTSNFGPDIDIAAPGTCIRSTSPGGGTTIKTGTSMAAPHVTGAAALYRAMNPYATPADVKAWLLANSEPQAGPNGFTGDMDAFPEPLVWLGGGGPVPTATPTQVPTGAWPLVRSSDSPGTSASTYVRDGHLDKIWKTYTYSSPPAEAWVWVDLGSRKPVGTIRWVFGQAGIGDYFEIEGSNNLLTWEYITKRNGKPVGLWQEKTLNKNYRYIRFRFENPNGDHELGGLWEVQVWAPGVAPPIGSTPTPTNTPTPTATVPPNGNYPLYGSQRTSNSTDPKAIWDGDLETTWQTDGLSTPASAWVLVTLGSIKPIETIRWQYGTADIGDDLTIEVSDDKVNWTPVHTEANNSPADVWLDVQGLEVSAKYVRWRFGNPNSDPVIGGLAEVEIYGPGEFGGGSERPATATPTITSSPSQTPEPTLTLTPIPTETEALPTETATFEPTATETLVQTETATETVAVETETETNTPAPEFTEPTPYAVVQINRTAASTEGTLAIDGDPDTTWGLAVGASPERLIVIAFDLGEPRGIGEVRIVPGPGGVQGELTIETSDDGEIWTWFAGPELPTPNEDGWIDIPAGPEITEPVTARYFRVVVTGTEGEPLGNIAEIEIRP